MHTELSDIRATMIGTKDDPKFKAKAAETAGVLPFMMEQLHRFKEKIPHSSDHIEAGECLVTFLNICRTAGKKLTLKQYQD